MNATKRLLQLWIMMSLCWIAPASSAETQIIFPAKTFSDLGKVVSAIGTMTGEGIGYPNNTYRITCKQSQMACWVTSVQQIGENQVSSVSLPGLFEVKKWNASEIMAVSDREDGSCTKSTLILKRQLKNVELTDEPTNQYLSECRNSDARVYHWVLDDSPYWKRILKK